MQYAATRRHRMNRVANYIRSNLAESLNLEKLAKAACLSKYQFIRVFNEHYRETPINYLWRLRLEYGARSLAYGDKKSITDIAMNFGYSTSQNFCKAFSRQFGMAPRTFKLNSKQSFRGLELTDSFSYETWQTESPGLSSPWGESNARIEVRPHTRVAYIRHIGDYWNDKGEITNAFDRLKTWAQSKQLWNDISYSIGMCPDDSDITHGDYCIYDACLPVPDSILEDDTVSIQTIPGGTFMIVTIDNNSSMTLRDAWRWLNSTWVRMNGMTYEFGEPYESFSLTNGHWLWSNGTELCIRLKPCVSSNSQIASN